MHPNTTVLVKHKPKHGTHNKQTQPVNKILRVDSTTFSVQGTLSRRTRAGFPSQSSFTVKKAQNEIYDREP